MTPGFTLSDLVGLAGSVVIAVLYFLSLQGRVDTTGLRYPLCNLVGCGLIIASLLHSFNLPSFLIEVFWSAVSLYGIIRYAFRSRAGGVASRR